MNELNELVLLVYLLSGEDVSSTWNSVIQDDLCSITPEHVMQLWQQLVQLEDMSFISVLFQFFAPNSSKTVKTKVLLITKEEGQLLVCNGIGSSNLVTVSVDDMVNLLDWWCNQPDCNIPLQAHPMYKKVFKSSVNVKSIHLFSSVHPIQENTNLRLAHFQMICDAAKCSAPPPLQREQL